jgi:hypothetical protein
VSDLGEQPVRLGELPLATDDDAVHPRILIDRGGNV